MLIRPIPMALTLALLSGVVPAVAQRGALEGAGPRTDILTGEPVRPPTAHPRSEPEIFNAPHAPRQQAARSGDNPNLEIYVAPQIGGGTGYSGNRGSAGSLPRRQYPGRVPQERRY